MTEVLKIMKGFDHAGGDEDYLNLDISWHSRFWMLGHSLKLEKEKKNMFSFSVEQFAEEGCEYRWY